MSFLAVAISAQAVLGVKTKRLYDKSRWHGMKMFRLFVVCTIAFLLLCGCGASRIILHNPETKQMAECVGNPYMNWLPAAAAESCAQGYEKAGYVRMSTY